MEVEQVHWHWDGQFGVSNVTDNALRAFSTAGALDIKVPFDHGLLL